MSIFYTITQEEFDAALEFAIKRMSGSQALYKARGELNLSKMEKDILTGAVAEIAVYNYLVSLGLACTAPDFRILKQKDKSFSADLNCEGFNIHVKSQCFESAQKYGSSWLFQKEDKLFSGENKKDLLILCLVNERFCSIEALIPASEIVKNKLIGEPKVWRYRDTKIAIYLNQILESNKGEVKKWIQKLKRQKLKRSKSAE